MSYDVVFIEDGRRSIESWEGNVPGVAFAKCLRAHPKAKLVSAHLKFRLMGNKIEMNYAAPSTARPEPLPFEPRKQAEMELNDPRRS